MIDRWKRSWAPQHDPSLTEAGWICLFHSLLAKCSSYPKGVKDTLFFIQVQAPKASEHGFQLPQISQINVERVLWWFYAKEQKKDINQGIFFFTKGYGVGRLQESGKYLLWPWDAVWWHCELLGQWPLTWSLKLGPSQRFYLIVVRMWGQTHRWTVDGY